MPALRPSSQHAFGGGECCFPCFGCCGLFAARPLSRHGVTPGMPHDITPGAIGETTEFSGPFSPSQRSTPLLSDSIEDPIAIDQALLTSEPDYDHGSAYCLAAIARKIQIAQDKPRLSQQWHSRHGSVSVETLRCWPQSALRAPPRRNFAAAPHLTQRSSCKTGAGTIPLLHTRARAWKLRGRRRPGRVLARSRRGCWTCRLRHKACPEDGVPCSACVRLGIECDLSLLRPRYMSDTEHAAARREAIREKTDRLRNRRPGRDPCA